MNKKVVDINDAEHPARKKAIKILEAIAEKLGNPDIFDFKDWRDTEAIFGQPDGTWYEYEDLVTNLILED